MNLTELGWNRYFEEQIKQLDDASLVPARVALEHRERYLVLSEHGQLQAEVSGKFRNTANSRADFPAVGDWVGVSARPDEGSATIHCLLPRRSSFSRKAVLAGGPKYGPGKTDEQVLAANVDTAFLVSGLDCDFSLRRIERYLTAAWDSGANPVIMLNKSDLCPDIETRVAEVEAVAVGVPMLTISAADGSGIDAIRDHLPSGNTAVFLGSSGVGKSTIINRLLGEERLKTNTVREYDSRGRHTTTYREMILLPDGGIVIDTPGLREFGIWSDTDSLRQTFSDVEQLITQCRFRDCSHETEPGCAVQQALRNGKLDSDRYASYLKLQKELQHLALRQSEKERRHSEREWDKKIRQHFQAMKDLRKKGLA